MRPIGTVLLAIGIGVRGMYRNGRQKSAPPPGRISMYTGGRTSLPRPRAACSRPCSSSAHCSTNVPPGHSKASASSTNSPSLRCLTGKCVSSCGREAVLRPDLGKEATAWLQRGRFPGNHGRDKSPAAGFFGQAPQAPVPDPNGRVRIPSPRLRTKFS